jgi:hypothetical protein
MQCCSTLVDTHLDFLVLALEYEYCMSPEYMCHPRSISIVHTDTTFSLCREDLGEDQQ